jgi:hypothetical protein
VNENFRERDTYLEGRLTDAPSFSDWDGMLDADPQDDEVDHG